MATSTTAPSLNLSTRPQVWAVIYDDTSFSDDLYERALSLMDQDSADRIRRFYHREDACRMLIGRLLTRKMLRARGITLNEMAFGATRTGKPYVTTVLSPPIAYNVTHDNELIALAFAPGRFNAPSYNVGIDVMKVQIPRRQTFASFVEAVREQLTPREHRSLQGVPQPEALRRFFWMWTFKEAYTKALGIGLGFDFSRVEYIPDTNSLLVDGDTVKGWWFGKFEVINRAGELYEGVVAEFVGGEEMQVQNIGASGGVEVYHAVNFVEEIIPGLS